MDSDNILLRRIGAYSYEFLMGIMVVLLANEDILQTIHWITIYFYLTAIKMHMGIYMKIYEKGQAVSIYQLLEYFPVNPEDIFRVRLSYLWKILYKRLIIFYIVQIPFMAYHKQVTVINIVYPVFTIIIVGISCIFSIKPK